MIYTVKNRKKEDNRKYKSDPYIKLTKKKKKKQRKIQNLNVWKKQGR